jgi:D-aminopeptidase
MARTGSDFSGRSGDYALAISTGWLSESNRGPGGAAPGDGPVPDKDLDLLFMAAIEATEEAILNSLFMAVTTTGVDGHTGQAVSLDDVTRRIRAASGQT